MNSIILPIQRDPFDRIFSYQKHYEFRKKLPLDTTEIYLYLSKVGIKGRLIISNVRLLDVQELIKIANLSEVVSGFKVENYFKGSSKGYVATIKERYLFNNVVTLPFVPQSYVYLDRYPELEELLKNNG